MPEIQVSPYGREYIEIPLSELEVGDRMWPWTVDESDGWTVTDISRRPADGYISFTRDGCGESDYNRPTSRRRIRPRRNVDVLVSHYGLLPQNDGEPDYSYLMRCLRTLGNGELYDRLNDDLWRESRNHAGIDQYAVRAGWIFDRLREEAGSPAARVPNTYTFPDSDTPVPAHQHRRGGGWVADTAYVAPSAYVTPDAMVYGNASVGLGARIADSAQVYGDAVIEEYARLDGSIRVYDSARIGRDAHAGGDARIHGTYHYHSVQPFIGAGDHTVSLAWRTCTRCRSTYHESGEHFSQSNGRFNAWCRECMRTYARERRAAATNNRPGNRRFGVEIEFHGDQRAVELAMERAGLACEMEGYNHQVRPHWKIVGDASVSNGGELVSPILRGRSGFAAIRKACAALREAGATVSIETGLHVHHDVAGLTVSAFKRMIANWYRCQDGIDEMVSPSRRDGQWSHHLDSYDMEYVNRVQTLSDARDIFGGVDRYKSLNINAYSVHGTVEVRMHQGTLNPDKIISWVKFGQAFIQSAIDGQDLDSMCGTELLGALEHLDTTACDFLRRRIRALASDPHSDEGEQDYDRYATSMSSSGDDECPDCGYYECECDTFEYVGVA